MTKSKAHLGEFEILVLSAVLHLGDEAYGVSVAREIEERAERSVSIAAVHTTLQRLERKQFVVSWKGEPTPERGGRAKRHFRLEPQGREALAVAYGTFERMKEGLALP